MKWRGIYIVVVLSREAVVWVLTLAGGGFESNENWFGVFGRFDFWPSRVCLDVQNVF